MTVHLACELEWVHYLVLAGQCMLDFVCFPSSFQTLKPVLLWNEASTTNMHALVTEELQTCIHPSPYNLTIQSHLETWTADVMISKPPWTSFMLIQLFQHFSSLTKHLLPTSAMIFPRFHGSCRNPVVTDSVTVLTLLTQWTWCCNRQWLSLLLVAEGGR